MKALRIKLTQTQASYTREETVNNRMTYPLPQFSTVIGALHNACGYKSYHPMDISIQGKYESMQSEIYINQALLDTTMDDRGILIYLGNGNMLNTGYITVAQSLGNNSSFENESNISVKDTALLREYIALKKLDRLFKEKERTEIKPAEKAWNKELATLKKELKTLKKGSKEVAIIQKKIEEGNLSLEEKRNAFNEKYEKTYKEPFSHFRTITRGPQKQEVLYNIELVIHVRAEEDVLKDILEHQYDFVSLGRSEDFIELLEMTLVELSLFNKTDKPIVLPDQYSMFVNVNHVDASAYPPSTPTTLYYLSKKYKVIKEQRVFERIPCLYSSHIAIGEEVLWDPEGNYIVDFN